MNNSEVFIPHSSPELNQTLSVQPRFANRIANLLLTICATFSKGLLPVARRCHRTLFVYPFGLVAGQFAACEHCRVIYFSKNGQGLSLYSDDTTSHALCARRHADFQLTPLLVNVRYISFFLCSACSYILVLLSPHSDILAQCGVVIMAVYDSARSGCLTSVSVVSGNLCLQPSTHPIKVYSVLMICIFTFLKRRKPHNVAQLSRPHRVVRLAWIDGNKKRETVKRPRQINYSTGCQV